MPDISSIGHGSLEPLSRSAATTIHRNGQVVEAKAAPREPDRVELSEHARYLDKMRQLPEGRLELVNQVKDAIEAGAYETEDKLNLAIARLLNDIDA